MAPRGRDGRDRGELDGLSAPARRFAEAAAVAGDPFELDLTVQTAGVTEPDALAALDELVTRDLVRSSPVPRRFQFRHPLVRRAVYESCPPGTRIAAHERSADALAARGAPAAARAHHVQHAARRFEIALGLLPQNSPPAGRVELLMALAGAHAATGRFEESRTALLESIDLTPGDEEAVRISLIGACAGIEQLLGHHEEAHARLTVALERLPDASSPRRSSS